MTLTPEQREKIATFVREHQTWKLDSRTIRQLVTELETAERERDEARKERDYHLERATRFWMERDALAAELAQERKSHGVTKSAEA